MRLSLWLILILAFSVGMGCALTIRALHFEAKPVVAQTAEPKTKILVATRTIPSGGEITADFVAFQEVSLSEVPLGAFSSFAQIYRRQSAYLIPADCPICEDLLLPYEETAPQAAFIPAGSQLVSLDVVSVRQGGKVFPLKEPLTAMLTADQRIDIRIIPRNEGQGRLAKMKNEVLRAHLTQDIRNSGELLLESVPIHQIQRHPNPIHTGLPKDSLVLILDKDEAAKLTAAAKRGQIRILISQNEKQVPQSEVIDGVVLDNSVEVVEQPLPLGVLLDIPTALKQPPLIPVPAVVVECAQSDSSISDIIAPLDSQLILAPVPDSIPEAIRPSVVKHLQSLDRLNWKPDSVPVASTGLEVGDKISIRNERPTVSFGMSPQSTISSERLTEQDLMLSELLPTSEAEPNTLIRIYSDAVMGPPRVTQAIKFLSPGSMVPTKEYPQEIANRIESTTTLPAVPSVTVVPIMPIAPPPTVPQEQSGIPDYSPFERRMYMVQPNEASGGSFSGELSPPPRLQRSSDAGM